MIVKPPMLAFQLVVFLISSVRMFEITKYNSLKEADVRVVKMHYILKITLLFFISRAGFNLKEQKLFKR
ncbi:hypothetical protein AT248_03135 [Bartonella henselae]|nr:hypothetical protein AT237_02640 [Bartonella henselae]OLL47824.1 hypothetical protein AT242_05030 [Bartonella henselae]OLL50723.1 hypothetical protein AT243_00405 [Bartonella henselae]OLL51020.1 hypothetical protein AT247_05005 [Bartonella henselae]OLL51246.1 hypothetical protein AT241_05825 [Bartonella henselae]